LTDKLSDFNKAFIHASEVSESMAEAAVAVIIVSGEIYFTYVMNNYPLMRLCFKSPPYNEGFGSLASLDR
jgi:hypothetical protein